ncbi:tetratricopeptide repeat protein [Paractinoplanes lichenicola]|uniref:tetratricopeptide repeat protein n=1 Tax=Paractinoplanes lichenicola TaxID=2802976 RepID=UPI0027DE6DA2|nr:tetratricopeptide repeat protein [Actinoplanes lichenicola]
MPADRSTSLPDPGVAGSIDGLVQQLRLLKVWADDPSYEAIAARINQSRREQTSRATVADCFKPGRRRLRADLVVAIVQALHPDGGYVAQWRQALRTVGGATRAAAQVRVRDALPPELPGFTGRAAELDRLLEPGRVAAIEGMAGIGKTQLALQAAHHLVRRERFDRVFFVDLRGFHPDPGQPPAEPTAVLDGLLRLLEVPGSKIPHDPGARAELCRERMAGLRALVLLDNAAGADQVRPLLPGTPGSRVLVTSRSPMAGLRPSVQLTVGVFSADEARQFLKSATAGVEAGEDPAAATRIAERCGHLPLALGLVASHMRATPGWTLTDHADRLDERHRDRRLESGVELALDLSYRHLDPGLRRLLRLLALHPGADLEPYAVAALLGAGTGTAREHLDHLRGDHLLQAGAPGRFLFHDLVRAYASVRAHEEDRPAERRDALTRLFDHYLATAAAAMDLMRPAEAHLRPPAAPAGTPSPALADADAARAWLDAERHNLVAAATHDRPGHTIRLARTLHRYLTEGHDSDAVIVHSHAVQVAARIGDVAGEAHALRDLASACLGLDRYDEADEHLRSALELFRQVDDPGGQARTLNNLGIAADHAGRWPEATEHFAAALALFRRADDPTSEARTLNNLAFLEGLLGRGDAAVEHYSQALALVRRAGDRIGESSALSGLGLAEARCGRLEPAAEHLRLALTLARELGHRALEADALESLGVLAQRLDRLDEAATRHRQALAIYRDVGYKYSEAWSLNGLGETAQAAGRPAEALNHHAAARAIAVEIGVSEQQARADAGLGHAHHTLGDLDEARGHWERAASRYAALGMPEAGEIRRAIADAAHR